MMRSAKTQTLCGTAVQPWFPTDLMINMLSEITSINPNQPYTHRYQYPIPNTTPNHLSIIYKSWIRYKHCHIKLTIYHHLTKVQDQNKKYMAKQYHQLLLIHHVFYLSNILGGSISIDRWSVNIQYIH